MGVDSGLPDFRGNQGFWKAYPPMKELGLSFYDLANPVWFRDDPGRAWGFYGHRRNLYRETEPHDGFEILKRWCDQKRLGGFVFTSNVDGHFQKSGFGEGQVLECHGSINFSQCSRPCSKEIWKSNPESINVDLSTFRANDDIPSCKNCETVARPNILMFGDFSWLDQRTEEQYDNYSGWLSSLIGSRVAIIEFGAGTAVPTVRAQCERQAKFFDTRVIRVNPREASGTDVISISAGALSAIHLIDELVG